MKKAYHLDKDGYITGVTPARESPREPGIYLCPAKSTLVDPPAQIPSGQVAKWNGSSWDMVVDPAPAIALAKEAADKEQQRQATLSQATDDGISLYKMGPDGQVVKRTDEEIALQATAQAWSKLRLQRDALLAECDYTVLPDAPISDAQKAAYRTYRQALRDLPANTSDPKNPVWPVKPS